MAITGGSYLPEITIRARYITQIPPVHSNYGSVVRNALNDKHRLFACTFILILFFVFSLFKQIQSLTDNYIRQVDELFMEKSKELLQR